MPAQSGERCPSLRDHGDVVVGEGVVRYRFRWPEWVRRPLTGQLRHDQPPGLRAPGGAVIVKQAPADAVLVLNGVFLLVASLLHRRKRTGPLATRLVSRQPLITFVTLGELTIEAEIRHWGTRRRDALTAWLSGIPVLPGDEVVAEV